MFQLERGKLKYLPQTKKSFFFPITMILHSFYHIYCDIYNILYTFSLFCCVIVTLLWHKNFKKLFTFIANTFHYNLLYQTFSCAQEIERNDILFSSCCILLSAFYITFFASSFKFHVVLHFVLHIDTKNL